MKKQEIKNTELWYQEVVGRGIDEQGRRFVKTVWKKADKSLNLGSKKVPNEKIIAIKYIEKRR